MRKRLLAALITFMAVAGAAIPASAEAVSPPNNSDIIWRGLWSGANFDLSGIGGRRPGPPPVPPTSPPRNPNAYAALGDSVAAGYGLTAATSPATPDSRCGRSVHAYPHEVAQARGKTLMHIACKGAKAGDLFTRQGLRGSGRLAPQLDTAFANGVPGLITLTAGANDVRWDTFLRKCYAGTCGTAFDTKLADGLQVALELKLYYLLYDINRRSGGSPPTVILTGYYNPLSPHCSALEPRFKQSEIVWASDRLDKLNQTIRQVSAQFPFARYAPVDFSGHDVCSANPWVQGANDPAPFHPTAQGQQAIARAALGAL
jgi:lysophospholipase L1-like esterase